MLRAAALATRRCLSTPAKYGDAPVRAKKTSIPALRRMHRAGDKITVLTAYDFPSAQLVERSGADVILVGDSVGMVVMGLQTTRGVTMEAMVHHCKAVSRGASRPLLIGDMPFGSYEASDEAAVTNAVRLLADGGMDAVKLEGGLRMLPRVEAIVRAGVPVMGHIGLTPQSSSALGGFVAQGKTAQAAVGLFRDAMALQEAGCWSLVLESVPSFVAREISRRLSIPTIGIGAGPDTSGQVLVFHDLLGLFEGFVPKFCRQYGKFAQPIVDSLQEYNTDVRAGAFPDPAKHGFTMSQEQQERFLELLEKEPR